MKHRIGDVVKIISKDGRINHAFDIGDTIRIVEHDSNDGSFRCIPVFCKKSFHAMFGQWVSPEDLEPIKTALDYILESL